MHNVFFGGIAQYYDSMGVLIKDDNVPFVKTIARVTRSSNGTMTEYKLPVEMPGLLGAGAEFIPIQSVPHFTNEVFKLDEFTKDSTLVGYIYGGISSTAANIFFANAGTQSSASSQVYKVYVIRNPTTGVDDFKKQGTGTLNMEIFPNPSGQEFIVKFHLDRIVEVKLFLYNTDGRLIEEKVLSNLHIGENSVQINNGQKLAGTYLLTLETPVEKASKTLIIVP
ncbi:MAG: hypothetical protein RL160_69 [Bacteroidota bacterium]